ncbi:hypothetical protein TA3x_001673 [Tundrisphaera sp. TA3]|uniref:hypothetical protein n=1 Tax=Tundrisphaera sp. TA3 TaxID=3435775 RepID=UPI003EBBAA64
MRIDPRCLGLALALAGPILTMAPGCGPADPYQRVAVSGKITVDGRPLESGQIGFLPILDGPAAQAEIAAGSYSIGRAQGPAAGPYRVEIRSIRPTGRKVPDHDNPGQMMDETRDAIHAIYNIQSRLQAEVKPGEAQAFDYAIDTRTQKK